MTRRPVPATRGLLLKLATRHAADLAKLNGFDFVVIDLEHSSLQEADTFALVRHAAAIGLTVVVRLAHVDAPLINRLLEEGADGFQISTVERRDQVDALVRSTRYAPAGRRSVSMAHPSADYGRRALRAYVDDQLANPPLLIVQIESEDGVANVEEIADAGPDVVFIGTVDLEVALGFDQDLLRRARTRVEQSARTRGLRLGGMAAEGDAYDYRVVGSDLALLAEAIAEAS